MSDILEVWLVNRSHSSAVHLWPSTTGSGSDNCRPPICRRIGGDTCVASRATQVAARRVLSVSVTGQPHDRFTRASKSPTGVQLNSSLPIYRPPRLEPRQQEDAFPRRKDVNTHCSQVNKTYAFNYTSLRHRPCSRLYFEFVLKTHVGLFVQSQDFRDFGYFLLSVNDTNTALLLSIKM